MYMSPKGTHWYLHVAHHDFPYNDNCRDTLGTTKSHHTYV